MKKRQDKKNRKLLDLRKARKVRILEPVVKSFREIFDIVSHALDLIDKKIPAYNKLLLYKNGLESTILMFESEIMLLKNDPMWLGVSCMAAALMASAQSTYHSIASQKFQSGGIVVDPTDSTLPRYDILGKGLVDKLSHVNVNAINIDIKPIGKKILTGEDLEGKL